ncbi:cationic peroxidase 1-like [Humulus lupulus]|uniref:cationic peroxidase 1-like n=1 Tax=Humulus lupulus TaxID=3486 RepID=UPI002B413098|nr:cationic peroxidase 1-like [Humulus lupulus]
MALNSHSSISFKRSLCLFLFLVVLLNFKMASAQLSTDFYNSTCSKALSTIEAAVIKAVANEQRMGASLLRLHFHDCFVNGCDASILLDDTSSINGEKTSAPNVGSVRGYDVIDTIKSQLESICPGVVSCADILAVAARDSVVALGGPSWKVELGRRDSTNASFTAANTQLPSFILDLDDLITTFSQKGFTEKELVALSGAHTTGEARCVTFRNRIYNETNIDSSLATSLKTNCSSSTADDDNLSSLDATSHVIFDNGYYKNLVKNKGLLHSDQQLFSGGSTDSLVTNYSENANEFYKDFANAMLKMGQLSPLTGTNGQIRTNCSKVN